jgi:LAO/AO transport system kinase
MQAHAGDPGVFIRSMATRGHLGGLARATSDAALVLDAAGKDVVVIETVGVGQDEVDIVRTADVSVVVLVPGAGDEVQALKAGIMEIADIFVVNKADREGADRTVASIEATLALQTFGDGEWQPPIIKTEATTGAGVTALVDAIERFRDHTPDGFAARRRSRSEFRLREILASQFMAGVNAALGRESLEAIVDGITARTLDPYSAAAHIFDRLGQVVREQNPGASPPAAVEGER